MATFRGTSGIDKLKGTSSSDLFESSAGNDLLDGSTGIDTVSYATNPGPVIVNLATGSAQKYALSPTGGAPVLSSTDTLVSIENVIGSRYNDTITGDAGNNIIAGLGGADTINGRGGIDTIDYSASANGVTIDLLDNRASGGDANGDSLTSIENVIGTSRRDVIWGSNDGNRLEGRDGDDNLHGEGGDDTLVGGVGQDYLVGDQGRDTYLYTSLADSPNITLGNEPADQLWDYIRDFESGLDRIDLRAIDANITQAGDQQFTVVTSFTGIAGQLVLGEVIGDGDDYFEAMLLADVNGDGQGDFAIEFHWRDTLASVAATDILL
jgi:Ca2+-binding RTX toxin-like protein